MHIWFLYLYKIQRYIRTNILNKRSWERNTKIFAFWRLFIWPKLSDLLKTKLFWSRLNASLKIVSRFSFYNFTFNGLQPIQTLSRPWISRQAQSLHSAQWFQLTKYQIINLATDSVSSQVLVARAVLLGDASVGKSSLSTRYFNDDFKDFHDVTFGGVFFKKEIKYSKDVKVSLQAWDTGG